MLLAQGDLWDGGSDSLGYFLLADRARHSVIRSILDLQSQAQKQPLYVQKWLGDVVLSGLMAEAWKYK